jgi:hypothetical protein
MNYNAILFHIDEPNNGAPLSFEFFKEEGYSGFSVSAADGLESQPNIVKGQILIKGAVPDQLVVDETYNLLIYAGTACLVVKHLIPLEIEHVAGEDYMITFTHDSVKSVKLK